MNNHKKILKLASVLMCLVMVICAFSGCGQNASQDNAQDTAKGVKVLIIPKFEIDEMSGDFPGEAQLFYEKYLNGAEKEAIDHLPEVSSFYYNPDNEVAMLITGSGKTATALALTAILSDDEYDFSDTYIVSVGCSGGSEGYTTYGDIVLNTAVCDNDLGHMADSNDMENPDADITWYYDSSYDHISNKTYNADLVGKAYDLIRDCKLQTTDITKKVIQFNYPDDEWANRDPQVIKGTAVTGDNFWKGRIAHNNANYIAETYGCEDPYADTEMEEIAVANTLDCYGLMDRLLSIRAIVNLDVFLKGESPELLWDDKEAYNEKITDINSETLDIFEPAMHNLFDVGEILIDSILEGTLSI